jgi:putative transcriptional regulator
MPSEPLAGRLLVATPVIGDPNFHRAVVFLLDHSDDGALGVVINRPTDVELDESLPGWDALAAAPSVVFVGGPVEQAGAIGLGRVAPGTWESLGELDAEVEDDPEDEDDLEDDDDGPWTPVLTVLDSVGPLATVDLTRDPLDLEGIDALRVFVGYAGWGPGQLEGELAQEAWVVADARPADLWSADPEGLWGRVLRRQGGTIAWLSLHPLDPSGN